MTSSDKSRIITKTGVTIEFLTTWFDVKFADQVINKAMRAAIKRIKFKPSDIALLMVVVELPEPIPITLLGEKGTTKHFSFVLSREGVKGDTNKERRASAKGKPWQLTSACAWKVATKTYRVQKLK